MHAAEAAAAAAPRAPLPPDTADLQALVQRVAERTAVGPRAGQKVFTLQSVAAQPERAGCHGAAEAGIDTRRAAAQCASAVRPRKQGL